MCPFNIIPGLKDGDTLTILTCSPEIHRVLGFSSGINEYDYTTLQVNILSSASGVDSPTNHQRQDTGSGILWSVNRWTKPSDNYPKI